MFQKNVQLSHYSNYKIGGLAKYFFAAKNSDEIIKAISFWRAKQKSAATRKKIFILGGGTNLLISDSGFDGLVIKSDISGIEIKGTKIRVGSGVLMSDLLRFASARGLSGLEWAGGLPGTVGGAVRGNAGAFGGETKDSVKEIISLDISKKTPKLLRRGKKECKFGYRDSIYKQHDGKEIIIEAVFNFTRGNPELIARAAQEKIDYRNTRHPMDYPNIGSIFKNVAVDSLPKARQKEFLKVIKPDPFPVVPTAYLIAQTGIKGVSFGGAMISPKHPNFIVNTLRATSRDVAQLIKLVKSEVKKKFGIKLEEEIIYL